MQNVARLPQTTKVGAAKEIVQSLYSTEAALDAAMLEANRLMQTMLEARAEMALPATFGAEALTRVTATLGELGQARTELVSAHKELDELRLRLNLRTSMVGVMDKPAPGDGDGRPG